MEKVKINLFPDDIFSGIEKKDSFIAIGFFLFILTCDFLCLYLVKISPLFALMKSNKFSTYGIIFIVLMDIPAIIAIIAILKMRKQKMDTVGLKKKGLKSSLIVGVILVGSFWSYYISHKGFDSKLIYGSIFYIIFIGFFEELVFRGFLWPRLVVGFGRVWGTIISGMFFGMMHIPMEIVFKNKTIIETFIFGNANVNIGGGVIAALWFIFIYSLNSNILLPSFVHGIQDLLGIL